MKSYYYVYRPATRLGPVIKHPTLFAAVKEAERLAAQHPGEPFEVLQCLAISQIVRPAVTFYADGVSPYGHDF